MFERLSGSRVRPVAAVAVVGLFLFAIQLLGAATEAAAPALAGVVRRVVAGDASALGLGWLSAYALANGSVVAAVALSLFTVDLLTPPQLFLLVAGSRLGGAAVVVFVGALDFVQKRRYSLREAVSMGLLTFLLTLSIYLPVTALGYLAWPAFDASLLSVSRGWTIDAGALSVFEPVTDAITTGVGPAPSFVLAVATLVGSLTLFDRLLSTVDAATLRERFFGRLRRTWLSFALGVLVTGATTSVAFSLGVIVPLYNRGYVERDELIPYVLGANLGTLVDTLVVAVVLESTVAVAVVLELLVVGAGVTALALLVHDRYSRLVVAVDDRLLEDRTLFVGFVLALVVVPLALVVVPLALS